MLDEAKTYVQFKYKKYDFETKEEVMLQIVNTTKEIMYEKINAEN
jgi:hypothetical protein